MNKILHILSFAGDLKGKIEKLLFDAGRQLRKIVIKTDVRHQKVNAQVIQIASISLQSIVLKLFKICHLSNNTVLNNKKTASKPIFFETTRIDYTGKSGFISIMAPAFE